MGESGSADDAVGVFREALSAVPYSLLMAFVYADWEEERKNYRAARAVYESLIPELAGANASMDSAAAAADDKKPTAAASASAPTASAPAAGVKKEEGAGKKEAAEASSSSSSGGGAGAGAGGWSAQDIPPIASDVAVVTSDGTTWILPLPLPLRPPASLPAADPLVYIQFMRFLRRTEGVAQARKAFILARKSKAVTYHSYVAAGLCAAPLSLPFPFPCALPCVCSQQLFGVFLHASSQL
jgi:hypothetical protein